MKTNKTASQMIFGMGAALALAMAASAPLTARADEPVKPMKPMKGGEMMMMKQIDTEAQAEELKPGDSIAMVCSMCKSVVTHTITTEKGHIKIMKVGEHHLCPGCGGQITVVGAGKGRHDVRTHVCDKCGGESAFCCATKPGEGATKGMEKEDEKK